MRTFPRVLSRWGVLWRGCSNEPRTFWFVLWATARQTLAHYLVGSRIVLGLHYRCISEVPLGAAVERSKCGAFPRVLSSRWGVKTWPECRGRALPFRHFWWHRVLFTMLNPSSDFPRVSLGITEEGSKYDAFPSNSLGAASELLNTPCRPLFSRLRAVGLLLVLQCTRGRPFVCLRGRPHGVFDSLRGSDSHLFSSWLH